MTTLGPKMETLGSFVELCGKTRFTLSVLMSSGVYDFLNDSEKAEGDEEKDDSKKKKKKKKGEKEEKPKKSKAPVRNQFSVQ